MANSPSKYGPKNQPETYSNNDGNFNINIPIQTTETFDPWECPGFTFIAGALYVPDNIKYNQPTEVPVIVSSEELTEFEYQNILVQPKKGLTLVWPAVWTHPHRGIPAISEDKFIMTGWCSFFHRC